MSPGNVVGDTSDTKSRSEFTAAPQNIKHKKMTIGDFNSITTTSHPPPQNPPPPPPLTTLPTTTHHRYSHEDTSTIPPPPPPPPPLNHNSFLNPLNDNSSTSFSNPIIVGGDLFGLAMSTAGPASQSRADNELNHEYTPSVRMLSKTAYVGHRRFLKKPHKWRSSREFNGQTDNRDPPKEFGQDEILAQLDRLPTRLTGKHLSYRGVKIKRNVLVELNWTKRQDRRLAKLGIRSACGLLAKEQKMGVLEASVCDKVDLFASLPTAAASSPAVDFFAAPEQVVAPEMKPTEWQQLKQPNS
ncbi:protein kinase, ATP binding site-containing protein [Tanacetum coccineum]|uniref:Protein kinase, ATP binding site-containing protein n=1 Tax=Tanacetum coccineum TaxID=301880 RepID=A0ABQ5CDZ9_9ASTR